MRFVFLLLFLAGLAAGVGSPFVAERFSQVVLGTWPAYQPASGFRAITVPLKPESAPLEILLDLSAPAPFEPDKTSSSATVTVAHDGRTVLAAPVSFDAAAMRDDNPQTPARTFRAVAGRLETVEAGSYTLTVARGEAEIPQVTGLDLVLRRATALDSRIQPVGFALAAIGFIGFMLTAFRRKPAASAERPPKPRWGRGGEG